ncbi:hypothetical protein [Pinirhizobacter sp.]|jgi:hypothetical protein|uniref:hypothetical protein n=1 Tax=Pinirhizobacter sp. TaxID=2950432 RepID=UPI002F3E6EBB
MEITPDDLNNDFLTSLGSEAIALLHGKFFDRLIDKFGYAVAFGRDPAKALEADLAYCLQDDEQASGSASPSIEVKYFRPGQSFLVAVVDCVTQFPGGKIILLNLIVSVGNSGMHVCIEGVSRA